MGRWLRFRVWGPPRLKRTHCALSRHATDIKYPNMKPIRGMSAATSRISTMAIIHSTSLTATADRTDTTRLEMIRMPRPTCGQFKQLPPGTEHRQILPVGDAVTAHLFHHRGVFWSEVMDEDADGAGHQSEDQRFHDAAVGDGVLQSGEPLAEDIEQQRHHTQGCNAGACRHDDAGRGERERDDIS